MKTNGGFYITRIKHLSSRLFEQQLRNSGIEAFNGPQGRILYVLWEYGPLSNTEIARLTSLAKTTLSSMLGRMEEEGLILRSVNPQNRRQNLVELTPLAKSYRASYDRLSEAGNELFYKGFAQQEIEEFESTLLRIIKNLEEQEEMHHE